MVKHSKTVLGCILVELENNAEGWLSWTQNKLADLVSKPSSLVSVRGKTKTEMAYELMDKHFGRASPPNMILEDYKSYALSEITGSCNAENMVKYYHSFVKRSAVILDAVDNREKPPVLVISGRQSWRNDATVESRSALHNSGHTTTLLEPSPSHMFPLEEAPKKCAVAMMLFIQGLGLGLSTGLTSPETLADTYTEDEERIVPDSSNLANV